MNKDENKKISFIISKDKVLSKVNKLTVKCQANNAIIVTQNKDDLTITSIEITLYGNNGQENLMHGGIKNPIKEQIGS